jgi:hypothetical protein
MWTAGIPYNFRMCSEAGEPDVAAGPSFHFLVSFVLVTLPPFLCLPKLYSLLVLSKVPHDVFSFLSFTSFSTVTYFRVTISPWLSLFDCLFYRIKRGLGGICKKGCRCNERLRGTDEGESLEHTRWNGGTAYLRRGKWTRDEKIVSGRWVCVCVKV